MSPVHYVSVKELINYLVVYARKNKSETIHFYCNNMGFKAISNHGQLRLFLEDKLHFIEMDIEPDKYFKSRSVLQYNMDMLNKFITEACDLLIVCSIHES